MTSNGNGRARFENRIADYYGDDGITDIEDYVPESKSSDVTVPREFFDEVKGQLTKLRELHFENQRLREAVRSLERSEAGKAIDIQAARFKLARAFATKLKRLRERASA